MNKPRTQAGQEFYEQWRGSDYRDMSDSMFLSGLQRVEEEAHEDALLEAFHNVHEIDRAEAATSTLNWGRLAYVLALIGPVDMDDTENAYVAYAEDIRERYQRPDLEADPQYADYVARLAARSAAGEAPEASDE